MSTLCRLGRAIFALIAVSVFSQPLPGLAGTFVRLESNLGDFEMELFDTNAPATVANFLRYVDSGRYVRTIVHRSDPTFVLQSGGYALRSNTLAKVPTFGAVTNEPGLSNLRGTVAMAKLGGNPNSATSQWFINLRDNSANLDSQNGGFTVFARVFGNGMRVADSMSRAPVFDVSGTNYLNNPVFNEFPLLTNSITVENLLLFRKIAKLPAATVAVSYDFASSDHGFAAGFADLPANYDPALYQLQSEHRALPANLGAGKGLFISGANRSDDLWMYWKKKITGLVPGTLYNIAVDLEFASSYAEGLVGIGGPPGEAVTIKVGAAATEPQMAPDAGAWLRMNLDKGNQSVGGKDLAAIGNVAKPDDSNEDYVRLHRDNRALRQTARAAADGSLWLVFGTDSGFEGTTSLYYTKLSAVLVPRSKAQGIAFVAIPRKNFLSRPFTLAAKARSGLPLTFTSSNPLVATVEGRRVTVRGVGETTITANQAGNRSWQPAVASRVLRVEKARQTITFNPPLRPVVGQSFDLEATASSGQTSFSYVTEPPGILTINGAQAAAVLPGLVKITAAQAGNENFLPASANLWIRVVPAP